MANRELRVADFIKLYQAHGCSSGINPNGYVVVERPTPVYLRWSQHAHKGLRDSFDRRIVAASRRRLGFDEMPDADFYAPVD